MEKIEYCTGAEELLDEIGPLWQKLNEQHGRDSTHFADWFAKRCFEERKADLLENKTAFRAETARENVTGRLIGYCISTIDRKQVGEIDSIYIEPGFRGRGIGDVFMRRALEWMDSRAVRSKAISVAEGNERVFTFYKRYGFYPRVSTLMQKS